MSVPQMTPAQLKRAKKLIRAECCNYDSANNECLALDEGDGCVCVQSISYSLLCRWFREAVLPLDEKLYLELTMDKKARPCVHCNRTFLPRSNSAKYCPACRKLLKRKEARERMYRKRHENMTTDVRK